MLKLKLTANSIDTDSQVTFYFNSLFHNTVDWKWLAFVDGQGLVGIDPATIQLAEDPRKVMLDAIRTRIYQEFDSCEHRFVHQVFESIIDEMEAKL